MNALAKTLAAELQLQAPLNAPDTDYAALGRLFEAMALGARQVRPETAELAIVIPTLNEAGNIEALVGKIETALVGVHFEIVFVDDDSRDETRSVMRQLAARDRRVRVVHRIGRRGLSTAVIEGVLATTSPFVAVMDADLQHDETLLAQMLQTLKAEPLDLVVGSRYIDQGDAGGLEGARAGMSRFATDVARHVLKIELADPMSGFFMMRREAFDAAARKLSGQGYKILVDLCASSPAPLRAKELPYIFRKRHAGESKLDTLVVWDFGMLLADKLVGKYVPVRFLAFAAVGGLGLIVHMAVLSALFVTGLAVFAVAQTVAVAAAMTFNFFVNNLLTYRDRRLKGVRKIALGLLTFCAACGLGAIANVGVANFLFQQHWTWWVSGVAGVLVGACWNYVATALTTWRK
jgi:dolichol-phosphate mannosyltransferase